MRSDRGVQVSRILSGPADPVFGVLPPPILPPSALGTGGSCPRGRCRSSAGSWSSPIMGRACSAPPGGSRAAAGRWQAGGVSGGRGVPRRRAQAAPVMTRNCSWEKAVTREEKEGSRAPGCGSPPGSARDPPRAGGLRTRPVWLHREDAGTGEPGPRLHPREAPSQRHLGIARLGGETPPARPAPRRRLPGCSQTEREGAGTRTLEHPWSTDLFALCLPGVPHLGEALSPLQTRLQENQTKPHSNHSHKASC